MLLGKRLRTRQALELSVGMFSRVIKTLLGNAWRSEAVCFMRSAGNIRGVAPVKADTVAG
jgi:hypothetical protein